MAGRGTDIQLGGSNSEIKEKKTDIDKIRESQNKALKSGGRICTWYRKT